MVNENTKPLDIHSLRVIQPCPVRWDEMEGGDQTRFCRHCQKNVYQFSAMTAQQVEQVVLENRAAGRKTCAQLISDNDGNLVTRSKQSRWLKTRQFSLMFLFKLMTFSATVLGLTVWFGPVISEIGERLIARNDQRGGIYSNSFRGKRWVRGCEPVETGGVVDE